MNNEKESFNLKEHLKSMQIDIKSIQTSVVKLETANEHQSKLHNDLSLRNEKAVNEHDVRLLYLEKIAAKTEGGLSTLNRILTLVSAGIIGCIIWVSSSIIEANKIATLHQKDLQKLDKDLTTLQIEVEKLEKQIYEKK